MGNLWKYDGGDRQDFAYLHEGEITHCDDSAFTISWAALKYEATDSPIADLTSEDCVTAADQICESDPEDTIPVIFSFISTDRPQSSVNIFLAGSVSFFVSFFVHPGITNATDRQSNIDTIFLNIVGSFRNYALCIIDAGYIKLYSVQL